ncbi:hypothetical protein SteCoe_26138 [Stentor coeruleus]|uniref:Uncharacterized protein n=1 Tax=Stentor coeruleus TaxID=5963 RepID=A0A1R2BDZ8_9CILI|nr:hypothetical protein SteCoe_26138 [Stentor coeruleus]
MKTCAKDSESYSEKAKNRAATPPGSKKLKHNKPKNSVNSNHRKILGKPNAPHNTTEYLMDQHTPTYYDPEELLGNLFGICSKENFSF